MSRDRAEEELSRVVEAYLVGALTEAARQELAASLARDPERARELARHVRLARALATTLREPSDAEVWSRVEANLCSGDADGRRLADAVDARLPDATAARAASRVRIGPLRARWAWVGLVSAAAAALLAGRLARRNGDTRGPPGERPETAGRVLTAVERGARPQPARVIAGATGAAGTPGTPPNPAGAEPGPSVWLETDDVLWSLEASPEGTHGRAHERALLRHGRVGVCPPGAPARRCFQALRQRERYINQGTLTVSGGGVGLFPFQEDALLVFDYWLGEGIGARDTAFITSYFGLLGQHPGYEHHPRQPAARGRWTRARLPLAEYARQRGAPPPSPGQMVSAFNVSCRVHNEDVFFLTNLRIVRGRRAE